MKTLDVVLEKRNVVEGFKNVFLGKLTLPPETSEDLHFKKVTSLSHHCFRQIVARNALNKTNFISTKILDELEKPLEWTAIDIEDAAIEHLQFVQNEDDFNVAYGRFISTILAAAYRPRLSAPFSIASNLLPENDSYAYATGHVWQRNNYGLVWLGQLLDGEFSPETTSSMYGLDNLIEASDESEPALDAIKNAIRVPPRSDVVYFQLTGRATRRAFVDVQSSIQSIVHAALYSKALLSSHEGARNSRWYIQQHLNAFWPDVDLSNKKGTLTRSLRNAVSLLSLCNKQTDPAISLALSTSAIEALLCKKTTGIDEELSGNVATLLQCDPGARFDFKKKTKDLYDQRSHFLHGDETSISFDASKQIRRLAAAVLFSVFEWIDYNRRIASEDEEFLGQKAQREFFSELEHAKISGRQLVGVPECACRWVDL